MVVPRRQTLRESSVRADRATHGADREHYVRVGRDAVAEVVDPLSAAAAKHLLAVTSARIASPYGSGVRDVVRLGDAP